MLGYSVKLYKNGNVKVYQRNNKLNEIYGVIYTCWFDDYIFFTFNSDKSPIDLILVAKNKFYSSFSKENYYNQFQDFILKFSNGKKWNKELEKIAMETK